MKAYLNLSFGTMGTSKYKLKVYDCNPNLDAATINNVSTVFISNNAFENSIDPITILESGKLYVQNITNFVV